MLYKEANTVPNTILWCNVVSIFPRTNSSDQSLKLKVGCELTALQGIHSSSANGSFVIRRRVRSGTTPSLPFHSLCSRISRSPPVILAIGGRLAILDTGLVRCPSPSPAPNWKPASLAHHTVALTGGISTVVSGARRDCGTFRCTAISATRGVRTLHFAEPPVFREEVDVGVKWA